MQKTAKFNDVLEATDHLTLDEKETLLEVLRHRTVEERRAQLKDEIADARREHASGKAKPASVRRIESDILK
jgi:hypothetical protein